MTDVRTMRSYLDLIAERDEALAEATRLADAVDILVHRVRAATEAMRAARSAEQRDPFHGHHPEHPTPQEAAG